MDIEEPKFLADFNHRVKTAGKRFYELANCTTEDISSRLFIGQKNEIKLEGNDETSPAHVMGKRRGQDKTKDTRT